MFNFLNIEDIKKCLCYGSCYDEWFEFEILDHDVGDIMVDKQVNKFREVRFVLNQQKEGHFGIN